VLRKATKVTKASPGDRGAARRKRAQAGAAAGEKLESRQSSREQSTRIVVMGRVLAPYGVNGWIKARAFTVTPETLIAYRSWWLGRDDGDWQELAVLEARKHGQIVLARLEGVSQREDALIWRGASIGVPRSALPKPAPDEVYLADLIGLTVMSREGVTLGSVAGLMETGVHAVLRVVDAGRSERLIPLVAAYVDAIELDAGRIVVDWHADY